MNSEPGTADDVRLQGAILSYSDEKAWGFVAAPGLEVIIGEGKGIFFHIKDFISSIANPFPVAGLHITFDFSTDVQGKPHACRVLPFGESLPPGSEAAPPQLARQQPAPPVVVLPPRPAVVRQVVPPPARPPPSPDNGAEADRLEGFILSYNEEKAWGFLSAPGLEAVIGEGKGIFFHIKDFVSGTLPKPGIPVSFAYSVDHTGKPRAQQVRPTAVPPPLFTDSANPSLAETHAAGISEWSTETPMPEDERLEGSIQSFSDEKAWGFIAAPGLESLLGPGKGVFFHIKDCVGLHGDGRPRVGYAVSFSIQTDQNGKLHAKHVTPSASAAPWAQELPFDESVGLAGSFGAGEDAFGDLSAAKRARLGS